MESQLSIIGYVLVRIKKAIPNGGVAGKSGMKSVAEDVHGDFLDNGGLAVLDADGPLLIGLVQGYDPTGEHQRERVTGQEKHEADVFFFLLVDGPFGDHGDLQHETGVAGNGDLDYVSEFRELSVANKRH